MCIRGIVIWDIYKSFPQLSQPMLNSQRQGRQTHGGKMSLFNLFKAKKSGPLKKDEAHIDWFEKLWWHINDLNAEYEMVVRINMRLEKALSHPDSHYYCPFLEIGIRHGNKYKKLQQANTTDVNVACEWAMTILKAKARKANEKAAIETMCGEWEDVSSNI